MSNSNPSVSARPVVVLDTKRDFVPPKPSPWKILKRRLAGLFGKPLADKDIMIKR